MHGLEDVPENLKGAVVVIGNFDGVHRGHQSIIAEAVKRARSRNVPALLLTFEPHPRDVFAPEPFMFRLTDGEAKAALARAMGMDGIVIMPFDRELASMEPERFVSRFLVVALGATSVVVGEDFHFGRARRGTPAFLREAGQKQGFDVIQCALLQAQNDPVSSSRIRSALNTGQLDLANRLLGYHWIIRGEVIVGDQRGRELGFPTANFELCPNCLLAQGVYAVRVRLAERLFDGVASLGKPMFDIHQSPFEVHMFDFDEDIYGQTIQVALISHIRGQMTFDGVDELVTQMKKDSEQARAALSRAAPLSELDRKLGFIIKG